MKRTALILTLCASLLSACAGGLGGPTATATIDGTATVAIETEQVLNTQNAEATADTLQVTVEAEATNVELTAEAATPTTRPLYVTQTVQANQALDLVQSLYDGDFISTVSGENLTLNSYRDSIAKINYISWQFTRFSPGDFVLQSDIHWESASEIANWFDAACGIVFREGASGNRFYVVFMYLDGNVEFKSYDNGTWRKIATKYYGQLDIPDGGAELLVTAEGEHIQVFINSKLVIDARDGRFTRGDLGFTVVSGTNKDFGTRCSFDNNILWELDVEE